MSMSITQHHLWKIGSHIPFDEMKWNEMKWNEMKW